MVSDRKKPRYVSLFSGAGGLDIGLERAGMAGISLCELEPAFCETLRANQEFQHIDGRNYFEGSRILNADIRELSGADLSPKSGIEIVVGGPPCQSFSSAGKQKSVLDPRGLLVNEFIRVVEELQPKMFLFENVRGLVTARDAEGEPGGVIRYLIDRFYEAGYSCRAMLLNSADYGSFQRRVRCFIIGSRRGVAPNFPSPTHQKQADIFQHPWNPLKIFLERNADKDTRSYVYPTEKLRPQIHGLPDGSGLKSKGKAEKTRPGGHWGYRQGTFIADLNLPARTVTGSSSQDWVRWDGVLRRLTLQEIKLLQGFPADWEIRGTKTQHFKQVGNAVPTVFGELLGGVIRTFLDDYPRSSPKKIDMPRSFRGYIEYTSRDQERNGESRSVPLQFPSGVKKSPKFLPKRSSGMKSFALVKAACSNG